MRGGLFSDLHLFPRVYDAWRFYVLSPYIRIYIVHVTSAYLFYPHIQDGTQFVHESFLLLLGFFLLALLFLFPFCFLLLPCAAREVSILELRHCDQHTHTRYYRRSRISSPTRGQGVSLYIPLCGSFQPRELPESLLMTWQEVRRKVNSFLYFFSALSHTSLIPCV